MVDVMQYFRRKALTEHAANSSFAELVVQPGSDFEHATFLTLLMLPQFLIAAPEAT